MKVWVILECYTDYKSGNATSFGVFKSKQSAIEHLPMAISDRLGMTIEEFEEDYGECFEDYFTLDREHWCWDRSEDVIEFYIQEDTLED